MSKLALVVVLVMSMSLVPLLAADTHPTGEHPDGDNDNDKQGHDRRSLLANLRLHLGQDPDHTAHALGYRDDGNSTRRTRNNRSNNREGEDNSYRSANKEGDRQGPGLRDGGNSTDGYGSEHVYYTGRNQRSRVRLGRHGRPARGARNTRRETEPAKSEPVNAGAAPTTPAKTSEPAVAAPVTPAPGKTSEPAPAAPVKSEPVNAGAAPVTPAPAKTSELAPAAPDQSEPATKAPVKTAEPATAAPVTPAPAKTSEPASAAPATPAPAKPVDASVPVPATARNLLAADHDDHDHDNHHDNNFQSGFGGRDHDHDHRDNHFGGGRTELVPHGDHFDRVPIGGNRNPWGIELVRHGDHFDRVPVFDTTRANPWDSIGHIIGAVGNGIANSGRRWLLASEPVVKGPIGSLKSKAPPKTRLGGLKLKNPLAGPKKAMHIAADTMSKVAHDLPKAVGKAVGMPRSLLAADTQIIVVNPGHSGHHHNRRRVRCGLLWCWN